LLGWMCPDGTQCRQGYPDAPDAIRCGVLVQDAQDAQDAGSRLGESGRNTTGSDAGHLFADALSTGTSIRPPRKRNPSPTPTRGNKSNGKHALVATVATLQEASGTSAIGSAELKQAESTVDQLSDRPLEGIPTHRDHTIIVFVFTWNTHTQIKMGQPPVTPLRNPLIIEQSRKAGAFDQVLVASCQVETIVRILTAIVSNNTGTAANPQQDIMIKSAETA